MDDELLSIGEVAARTGLSGEAHPALPRTPVAHSHPK
jgi:hypothetical protein